MLTANLIKEELSYAYVHAIASRASFECNHGTRHDIDSIDATILAKGRLATDSLFNSPRIELQLKATSRIAVTTDTFPFDLPIKNYNDLRQRRASPAYLVVFIMPTNELDWLTQNEESLISRHCAYWCSLLGAPSVDNAETRRVQLPRANLLTVDALTDLMIRASRREEVMYVE